MTYLNITASQDAHSLPDLTHIFEPELISIIQKLSILKSNFQPYKDIGYSVIYYTLKMLIEYQEQGNGAIPENIFHSIKLQVFIAARSVHKEIFALDKYESTTMKILLQKVSEHDIVTETITYWDKYNL